MSLCVFDNMQMVGTLSLGPHSKVHDVWQNLEDVGFCFELKTVTHSGERKTNVFVVRSAALFVVDNEVTSSHKVKPI